PDRTVGDPEQAVGGSEPDQALAVLEQGARGIAFDAVAGVEPLPGAAPVAQHRAVRAGDPERAVAVLEQGFGALGALARQPPRAQAPDAGVAAEPDIAIDGPQQGPHLLRRQAKALAQRLQPAFVPARQPTRMADPQAAVLVRQ